MPATPPLCDVPLNASALREKDPDPRRLLLWLPGAREWRFQHWERIAGQLPEAGLSGAVPLAFPARVTAFRQKLQGGLRKFLPSFWSERNGSTRYILPTGEWAEAVDQPRTDALLVWTPDEAETAGPAFIQEHWPAPESWKAVGPNLFLVLGVDPASCPTPPAPAPVNGVAPAPAPAPALVVETPALAAEEAPPNPEEEFRQIKKKIQGLQEQGLWDQALGLARHLLGWIQGTWGEDHPLVLTGLNQLGWLYQHQGDGAAAERYYRQALALHCSEGGDNHPNHATSMTNLALLCQARGEREEAEALLRRALGIRLANLGQAHPLVAVTLNNLAGLYNVPGQAEAVGQLMGRALDVLRATLGEAHPDFLRCLDNLIAWLQLNGQEGLAGQIAEHARQGRQKTAEQTLPRVADSLNVLARWAELPQTSPETPAVHAEPTPAPEPEPVAGVEEAFTSEDLPAAEQPEADAVSAGRDTDLLFAEDTLLLEDVDLPRVEQAAPLPDEPSFAESAAPETVEEQTPAPTAEDEDLVLESVPAEPASLVPSHPDEIAFLLDEEAAPEDFALPLDAEKAPEVCEPVPAAEVSQPEPIPVPPAEVEEVEELAEELEKIAFEEAGLERAEEPEPPAAEESAAAEEEAIPEPVGELPNFQAREEEWAEILEEDEEPAEAVAPEEGLEAPAAPEAGPVEEAASLPTGYVWDPASDWDLDVLEVEDFITPVTSEASQPEAPARESLAGASGWEPPGEPELSQPEAPAREPLADDPSLPDVIPELPAAPEGTPAEAAAEELLAPAAETFNPELPAEVAPVVDDPAPLPGSFEVVAAATDPVEISCFSSSPPNEAGPPTSTLDVDRGNAPVDLPDIPADLARLVEAMHVPDAPPSLPSLDEAITVVPDRAEIPEAAAERPEEAPEPEWMPPEAVEPESHLVVLGPAPEIRDVSPPSSAVEPPLFGPADLLSAAERTRQAEGYRQAGDLAAAEPLYQEALVIFGAVPGGDESSHARALTGLGRVFALTGRAAEALELVKQGLARAAGPQGNLREVETGLALLLTLACRPLAGSPRAARIALDAVLRHKPGGRTVLARGDLGRQGLALALPAGSALVELVCAPLGDFQAGPVSEERPRPAAHYLALVLPAGEPDHVTLLDLGAAEAIDQQVADFRACLTGEAGVEGTGQPFRPRSRAHRAFLATGSRLRQSVFDPLAGALAGRTRLFLAAAGELAGLPFEVLPADEERYLLDTHTFSYLLAGRDLLRFQGETAGQPAPPVVAADPDFCHAGEELPVLRALARGTAPAVRPFRGEDEPAGLAPLRGTRRCAQAVAGLLGVEPWLARAVRKERLLALHSPCILHLATHCIPAAAEAEEDGRWLAPVVLERVPSLALAGANRRGPGMTLPEEDSYLTAAEVAGLDLAHTELVVLPAGVPDAAALGLCQAFSQAGAATVVTTLWRVADWYVKELLLDFYGRLLAGAPRAEALVEARRALKARYPYQPGCWGAFICQGNPGPL